MLSVFVTLQKLHHYQVFVSKLLLMVMRSLGSNMLMAEQTPTKRQRSMIIWWCKQSWLVLYFSHRQMTIDEPQALFSRQLGVVTVLVEGADACLQLTTYAGTARFGVTHLGEHVTQWRFPPKPISDSHHYPSPSITPGSLTYSLIRYLGYTSRYFISDKVACDGNEG